MDAIANRLRDAAERERRRARDLAAEHTSVLMNCGPLADARALHAESERADRRAAQMERLAALNAA